MDWLIDFIAGNLMFIVIALGILTSLFRKGNEGKGDSRQAGRPSAGGPSAGGPFAGSPGSPFPGQTREDRPSDKPDPFDWDFPGLFDDDDEEDEVREPERPARPAVQERTQGADVQPHEPVPMFAAREEEDIDAARPLRPRSPDAGGETSMAGADKGGGAVGHVPVPRTSPVSDSNSPIYRPESAEDMSRQALQGMIWSEVYGPPLAKRPMLARLRRNG